MKIKILRILTPAILSLILPSMGSAGTGACLVLVPTGVGIIGAAFCGGAVNAFVTSTNHRILNASTQRDELPFNLDSIQENEGGIKIFEVSEGSLNSMGIANAETKAIFWNAKLEKINETANQEFRKINNSSAPEELNRKLNSLIIDAVKKTIDANDFHSEDSAALIEIAARLFTSTRVEQF